MLRPDPTVPALGVALMGTLVTSWLERDFLPSRRTGEVLSVAMLSALILLAVRPDPAESRRWMRRHPQGHGRSTFRESMFV